MKALKALRSAIQKTSGPGEAVDHLRDALESPAIRTEIRRLVQAQLVDDLAMQPAVAARITGPLGRELGEVAAAMLDAVRSTTGAVDRELLDQLRAVDWKAIGATLGTRIPEAKLQAGQASPQGRAAAEKLIDRLVNDPLARVRVGAIAVEQPCSICDPFSATERQWAMFLAMASTAGNCLPCAPG